MKHTEPEIVTRKLLDELHRISPNDPDHLPREIELIEIFRQRHPKLTQLVCFDTAFHQTMPRVAKLLSIPRRFDAKGIQRYGFHGLSYACLMEELARLGEGHVFPRQTRTVAKMGENDTAFFGFQGCLRGVNFLRLLISNSIRAARFIHGWFIK